MRKIAACFLAFTGAGLLAGANACARDQIQIAGSSTVLPYAKIVAEAFGDVYLDYKIPVIESGGTGAGIKEFCRGVGVNTIDIVNASRRMEQSELASCKAAGVGEVQEVRFGYDGIVLATDISKQGWNLTPGDVYKALAAQVMVDGRLQKTGPEHGRMSTLLCRNGISWLIFRVKNMAPVKWWKMSCCLPVARQAVLLRL